MFIKVTEVHKDSAWYPDDDINITQGQLFRLGTTYEDKYVESGFTSGYIYPVEDIVYKQKILENIYCCAFKYEIVDD